jgi:hypothetical protein
MGEDLLKGEVVREVTLVSAGRKIVTGSPGFALSSSQLEKSIESSGVRKSGSLRIKSEINLSII